MRHVISLILIAICFTVFFSALNELSSTTTDEVMEEMLIFGAVLELKLTNTISSEISSTTEATSINRESVDSATSVTAKSFTTTIIPLITADKPSNDTLTLLNPSNFSFAFVLQTVYYEVIVISGYCCIKFTWIS